jgi:signal transduction histidine kinase
VSDNGPGLQDDDAARIFQLFQRGARSGSQAGYGVGLAIVKHLVEKLGGRVWVESTSAGSRFYFSLPERGA